MPTSHNDEPRATPGSVRNTAARDAALAFGSYAVHACLTPVNTYLNPGRHFHLQTHAGTLQTETEGDQRGVLSVDGHAYMLARMSTASIWLYLLPFVQLPLLGNINIRYTHQQPPPPSSHHAMQACPERWDCGTVHPARRGRLLTNASSATWPAPSGLWYGRGGGGMVGELCNAREEDPTAGVEGSHAYGGSQPRTAWY